MSFIAELKRRNVVRVGIAYAVAAWALLQVLDVVGEILELPPWGGKLVLVVIVAGFFVTLFAAWAFELTPDGIKRDSEVDQSQSIRAQSGRKLDRIIISLLVVAVMILLGDRFVGSPATEETTNADSQASQQNSAAFENSIAVLPLVNLSTLAENAFFVGGLHDEILNNLSRAEGLHVVSRTSVMPYFDSDKSLSTIGEELGANYIVEGSVRRIDNHVRIIVQLIEASSDRHLWANNFDRQLQDEFAAQSAAAKDIAGSIHRELVPNSGGSVSGLPTDNIKAYDLFTRAQNIAKTEAESEATFHRQRELLEQAVAEDPEFVEAWGMLNEVLDHSIRSSMMNGWFIDEGEDPNAVQDEMAAAAKHSLEQAVSLDPDNFWTLLARHHDPMEEYRAEFNAQSIELVNRIVREYPEQPLGWLALGWSYHYGGDMELADTAFRKAIELDPFHAGIVYSCLHHFRSAGNQDMVDMLYDRLAQIAPEDGDLTRLSDAGVDTRLWNLLQAYFQSPDDRLIDRHGEILFDPDSRFISSYSQLRHEADYWAIRDDPDRILALVDRFEWSGSSSFMDVAHFNFVSIVAATIYFERGEMENARSLARQILATASAPQANFPGTVVGNFNAYARACGVLGDDDCARDWAENAMEKGRDQDFWSRFSGYMALSAVDVDRAVQLILEDKTADPRYLGTDVIATFQIFNRHVLRHPDMIDFYRQEGKWIDYLSQRMPEYAQD